MKPIDSINYIHPSITEPFYRADDRAPLPDTPEWNWGGTIGGLDSTEFNL